MAPTPRKPRLGAVFLLGRLFHRVAEFGGEKRQIELGGVLAFHGEVEAAFPADVARDDVDVEVGHGLARGFAAVGEDVDALGPKDGHLGLADALGDGVDLGH